MGIQIGGEKAWRTRTVHDIFVSFQWVNGEGAMVLFPAMPRSHRPGAFIIGLSSLFKYRDARYLAQQSVAAAKVMGFEDSSFTWQRIAGIIEMGLDELKMMPPEPNWGDKRAVAEVTAVITGSDGFRKEFAHEIKE